MVMPVGILWLGICRAFLWLDLLVQRPYGKSALLKHRSVEPTNAPARAASAGGGFVFHGDGGGASARALATGGALAIGWPVSPE